MHLLHRVIASSHKSASHCLLSGSKFSFPIKALETMRNLGLKKPELRVRTDATSSLGYAWQSIRVPVIIPLLSLAIMLCSVMSIMLFIERVYMAIIILCVKLLGKKRYTKYELENMKEDLELNKSYPMVLVQIPMHNEKNTFAFKHINC